MIQMPTPNCRVQTSLRGSAQPRTNLLAFLDWLSEHLSMRTLIAILIFFGAQTWAQSSLPLGEREAFLGNIGIAKDGTVGNTYYNPAGLAFGKTSKLVGSGTLLQVSNQKAKESNVTASFSQTQALPIGAGTSWSKDSSSWAFSVYNLENTHGLIGISVDLPGIGTAEGRARVDQFSVIVGPSWAKKISENMALGVSAFYFQQENSTMITLPFQRTVGANTAIGAVTADSTTTARAIKLVVGGLARYEYFDIGVRLETGPLLTQSTIESSSANIFYVKDAGNNIVSETTDINPVTKENAKFNLPHLLGVGVGTLLSPRMRLYSDLNYGLAMKYRPRSGDDENEFKGAIRAGAGIEYTGSLHKWLGGFSFIQDADSDDVYLYLSGGYITLDKRTDSAVGLFYLTTLKADETNINTIGLAFSSSIKL